MWIDCGSLCSFIAVLFFWYQWVLFTSFQFCVLKQTIKVIQPNAVNLQRNSWISYPSSLNRNNQNSLNWRGTVLKTKLFACCVIWLQHPIVNASIRFRYNNANGNEKKKNINKLLRKHVKFMSHLIRFSYFIRPIHDEMENTFNIPTCFDSCKFFESSYINRREFKPFFLHFSYSCAVAPGVSLLFWILWKMQKIQMMKVQTTVS